MKKDIKLKSHKLTLLCSLLLDAEIDEKIVTVCERVIGDVYNIESLANTNYFQELSNRV